MLETITLPSPPTPANNNIISTRVPKLVDEISEIDMRMSFGPLTSLQAQQRLVVK